MKRRMIAQDIVSEGRFLRMSLTAQALYMHLVANADDDGCVDAYTITRMIGAKEDDLVLLKEREYIVILDEKEYILWISGWQDFNWIEPRYKEDSKYLPLLRSKIEGLEIVESSKADYNKRRYASRKLEKELSTVQTTGSTRGVHCVHPVQTTGKPPPSIGKDRIDKDSTTPAVPSGVQGEGKRELLLKGMQPSTRELWDLWEKHRPEIVTELEDNRSALNRLLELEGTAEKVERLIELSAKAYEDRYCSKEAKASSPRQLFEKRSALLSWGKGKYVQTTTVKIT